MKPLKIQILILISFFALIPSNYVYAQQEKYDTLKTEAEKYYDRGSFSKSHELYIETRALQLTPRDRRWADFRIADTQWRAQAGSNTPDPSTYEQAQKQLDFLIRDIQREEDKDRVWAEVQESLGDFWWQRRDSKNWGAAWNHYQQALEWWAGAKDIDLARTRYLNIIWTIASPPWREPYYYYGYYGNTVPIQILENALKISQSEKDKVRAHYLLAMALRNQDDFNSQDRVAKNFTAVLEAGKSFDGYDDALFHYAEWLSNYGDVIILENGVQRRGQSYLEALKLYRRILREFRKGETRHYDAARQRIENITQPVLGIQAANIFLPGSEIQLHFNWRNMESAGLSIYPVDLTEDVEFAGDRNANDWIQQIHLPLKTKITSWTEETEDKGDFKPGQKTVRLKKPLPRGAYIVEAVGGGKRARDLILVTDGALVLKTSGTQALVYFCDALDGSPIATAKVTLWERYYSGKKWVWEEHSAKTDNQGLAVFSLKHSNNNEDLFASAQANDRQAFSVGYSHKYHLRHSEWKLYVFTDRPAYRPSETAQWKVTARNYDGSVYSVPANTAIEFEITDPRGSKLKEGTLQLNEFGSAWDDLDLTESLPLGAYQVAFWDKGKKKHIGSASLFRLEEYKLPEFKVGISTPEENGKQKTFRLGDTVEVNIQADYYFGGPVANANVEVLVTQRPFYHHWRPAPQYPWYYEDISPSRHYRGGRGLQVAREVLKTGPEGKAKLKFATPRNNQDMEYVIEARVTDASRREITASETVRVTRQSYYVYLNPEHTIYRPQDKLKINFRSLDANSQPVRAEGLVKVTRDYWFEIWIDPEGREVQGEELTRLRGKTGIFPPPPSFPDGPGWRLKFQGYRHDDILTRSVKTDAEGNAEFAFAPEREGYYRVQWTSQEKGEAPIKSETTVWVATNASTDLNTRHGGLEIIADRDTFRTGQKAPVMLMAPSSGRYVLFSVEGDDLYSYRLIHMEGTVKLIELEIEEQHVPNIFLNAVLVSDRQIFQDSKQIIVPPDKHFLTVEVEADKEAYQPQEEGTFTVTTLDRDGKPVPAEVALGVADASVYYIQKDPAPDPRQFFFGRKRYQRTQTKATFQFKAYKKLVENNEGQLLDELEMRNQRTDGFRSYDFQEDGFLGGKRENAPRSQKAALGKSKSGAFANREEMAQLSADAAAPMAADVSGGVAGKDPAVQVRSDFRSTAFWQPDLTTGKNGKAVIKLRFPDSLTAWKATARAVSESNQFGMNATGVRTQKPLIVRLQAPRFFVVGDALTLSAIVNNNTDAEMHVTPGMEADGLTMLGAIVNGRLTEGKATALQIPAGGEQRVDWQVRVDHPGEAHIRVTARGKHHTDTMEKTFPVHEHGIEKFLAQSGKMTGEGVTVSLNIPAERKQTSTELRVQVAPSLAVTLLDSLPYLIDYPYGCTEQTMSRFLPAVITAKTLSDLGLKPESIAGRIFGGIDPAVTGKTHPRGKKNLADLDNMVRQGLDRLYDFQHADGGWGWWKQGESDPFMSAYVLWGLALAKGAGVAIDLNVLNRAARFLDRELVEEENNFDHQAWMLHALSVLHASVMSWKVSANQSKAFENLWNNRARLNAYSRSLLALAAHHYGDGDRAKVLIENLENGVQIDRSPDTSIVQRGQQTAGEWAEATAHWGEDGIFRRWSDGGVEATAFALQALLAIDPDNKLVGPVTHWLIKNRRGAHWSNTRDTAITVLALNEYLKQSGEMEAQGEYELLINGQSIARTKVEDVLTAPGLYLIDRKFIRDGNNSFQIIRHKGKGPLYFSVQAEFFSLEEPISPAGNEIFLRRQYVKLEGRPTLLKGYVYDKVPLNDGDTVNSGDRIESVLTLETKNNYEYLIIEDLKPAGVEAVEIQSGQSLFAREIKSAALDRKLKRSSPEKLMSAVEEESVPSAEHPADDFTGRTRWVYQELRDRKTALFLDKLPEGIWEIRTTLRAEIPGEFHALPVLGHAMYIPEIRASGAEIRFQINDREQ